MALRFCYVSISNRYRVVGTSRKHLANCEHNPFLPKLCWTRMIFPSVMLIASIYGYKRQEGIGYLKRDLFRALNRGSDTNSFWTGYKKVNFCHWLYHSLRYG